MFGITSKIVLIEKIIYLWNFNKNLQNMTENCINSMSKRIKVVKNNKSCQKAKKKNIRLICLTQLCNYFITKHVIKLKNALFVTRNPTYKVLITFKFKNYEQVLKMYTFLYINLDIYIYIYIYIYIFIYKSIYVYIQYCEYVLDHLYN